MKKDTYKKLVVSLSIITLLIYIIWRIGFTLPTEYGIVVLACGILMLISEISATLETVLHLISSMRIEEPELPVIPDEWYPDVDVFIATHNEPLDVLYKTANGCKHMKYPDKNKVHICFVMMVIVKASKNWQSRWESVIRDLQITSLLRLET